MACPPCWYAYVRGRGDVYYTIYVQSTHKCARKKHLSYVAFVFYFSVCRNPCYIRQFYYLVYSNCFGISDCGQHIQVARDVVTVFSLSSIINIYIYLEDHEFYCGTPTHSHPSNPEKILAYWEYEIQSWWDYEYTPQNLTMTGNPFIFQRLVILRNCSWVGFFGNLCNDFFLFFSEKQ